MAREGDSGSHGAMREPIEELCERRDAEGHDRIAEQAGTKPEGSLLHSGIQAGSERDVGDFDQDDGESPVRGGARQRGKVNGGARGCTEQGTLPVPAGEHLREKGRTAGGRHESMVTGLYERRVKTGLQKG